MDELSIKTTESIIDDDKSAGMNFNVGETISFKSFPFVLLNWDRLPSALTSIPLSISN